MRKMYRFGVLQTIAKQSKNLPIALSGLPLVRRIPGIGQNEALRTAVSKGAIEHQQLLHTLGEAPIGKTARGVLQGITIGTEAMLRTTAAELAVARSQTAARRLHKRFVKLSKDGTVSHRNILDTRLGRELKDLGLLDAEVLDVARTGKLSESQQRRIARAGVALTQGFARPMDLPIAWSTPAGRVMTQFWAMAYKQTQNTIFHTLRETSHGNLLPVLRFIPIAIASGWTMEELGDVLYGKDPPDTAKEKTARWMRIMANSLGILDKPLSFVDPRGPRQKALTEALTPVIVSDVEKLIGGAVHVMRELSKGEEGEPIRAVRGTLRISGSFRTIANIGIQLTAGRGKTLELAGEFLEPWQWRRKTPWSPESRDFFRLFKKLDTRVRTASQEFRDTGVVSDENKVTREEAAWLTAARAVNNQISRDRKQFDHAVKFIKEGVTREQSWARWQRQTLGKPGIDKKGWLKVYDLAKNAKAFRQLESQVFQTLSTKVRRLQKVG